MDNMILFKESFKDTTENYQVIEYNKLSGDKVNTQS